MGPSCTWQSTATPSSACQKPPSAARHGSGPQPTRAAASLAHAVCGRDSFLVTSRGLACVFDVFWCFASLSVHHPAPLTCSLTVHVLLLSATPACPPPNRRHAFPMLLVLVTGCAVPHAGHPASTDMQSTSLWAWTTPLQQLQSVNDVSWSHANQRTLFLGLPLVHQRVWRP